MQDRAVATRRTILTAAAEVIMERGYGASISQITTRACVAAGAVYFHLRSKEDLAHGCRPVPRSFPWSCGRGEAPARGTQHTVQAQGRAKDASGTGPGSTGNSATGEGQTRLAPRPYRLRKTASRLAFLGHGHRLRAKLVAAAGTDGQPPGHGGNAVAGGLHLEVRTLKPRSASSATGTPAGAATAWSSTWPARTCAARSSTGRT